jgi:hypothetical protein
MLRVGQIGTDLIVDQIDSGLRPRIATLSPFGECGADESQTREFLFCPNLQLSQSALNSFFVQALD